MRAIYYSHWLNVCIFLLILIMYSNILSWNVSSWNIIEKKKHLATWGLEPASPVSVNRHAIALQHHASPKKDASIPELSNTVFFTVNT